MCKKFIIVKDKAIIFLKTAIEICDSTIVYFPQKLE